VATQNKPHAINTALKRPHAINIALKRPHAINTTLKRPHATNKLFKGLIRFRPIKNRIESFGHPDRDKSFFDIIVICRNSLNFFLNFWNI
jgi:hypothetical protein